MSQSHSQQHPSRYSLDSTDYPVRLYPDCYFFHERAGDPSSPTECALCYAYMLCRSEYDKDNKKKKKR